jgi:hypothetical protein
MSNLIEQKILVCIQQPENEKLIKAAVGLARDERWGYDYKKAITNKLTVSIAICALISHAFKLNSQPPGKVFKLRKNWNASGYITISFLCTVLFRRKLARMQVYFRFPFRRANIKPMIPTWIIQELMIPV